MREEDPRALGWWIVGRLIDGELEPQKATALTSLIRAIAALGPSPISEREALAEIELRGLLMHGLPPRTADEWERAERIFSAEALVEITRRAELLGHGNGADIGEPLFDRESAAGETDVALTIHEEHSRGRHILE